VGELREKALFIVRGPKNSGKTTFLEALRAMMGDYALSADFEKTFGQMQRNGGASPELARLAGARLVLCSEIEPGTKVSQHLVKRVTGGDPLTARHLFKGYFDFRPQFTLLLVCNDDIRFSLEDDAMWERIKRIPFPFTIPKADQDTRLQTVLRDPEMGGKALLAWAVEGCLLWQREGLMEPQAVIDSTLQYRQELDPLADWFDDCVELEPDAFTSTADLYESYTWWCNNQQEKPIHIKTFGKLFPINRPVAKHRTERARGYRGVRLT